MSADPSVPALTEGEWRGFDLAGRRILLCNVAGRHYAVSNVCPHARMPLSEGRLEGFTITCPLHGASFDVRTGQCQSGPATDDLAVYPVRVEDGNVVIGG